MDGSRFHVNHSHRQSWRGNVWVRGNCKPTCKSPQSVPLLVLKDYFHLTLQLRLEKLFVWIIEIKNITLTEFSQGVIQILLLCLYCFGYCMCKSVQITELSTPWHWWDNSKLHQCKEKWIQYRCYYKHELLLYMYHTGGSSLWDD